MHMLWSINSKEGGKIGATRCQMFRHKIRFPPVLCPQTPLKELTVLPQTPLPVFQGPISKGKGSGFHPPANLPHVAYFGTMVGC